MDFAPLIDQKRRQFDELQEQIASSTLFENPKKAREVMREHSRLKTLLGDWNALQKSRRQLEEDLELAAGSDSELAELAQAEIPALEKATAELTKSVQYALLPPEPHEDRDAIVEIRAVTGGNEAALFAADLYRMYSKYAESHGFRLKQLEQAEKYSAHRRNLIGSGGREEKIRTYNFPQNRVTDHRIGLTLYNLDLFMDGQLDDMVNALQVSDMEQRLKDAGLEAHTQ